MSHAHVVTDAEWRIWGEVSRCECPRGAAALALCGPSGAGKTTTAQLLTESGTVFIEATVGNPYLPQLLAGRMDQFDAEANQAWFLDRMLTFVRTADATRPLILDQDPAAIVFAYAQMWRAAGRISNEGFCRLLAKLLELETALQRWRAPRATLWLDAVPHVLHARVAQRDMNQPTPPLLWFGEVRQHFASLRDRLPRIVPVPTSRSPHEIAAIGRELIEH